ncbi:hypothetical protein RJ639_031041 [Escallonia herrerae]|uniref:Uncharacterized protein n=1 Tax=Escallonia herrerae TaxID=1293975 RepID=A0AA89BBE5_9ASTE|nr:hypothetical protein RJ639_031041 [Escallonia herrerae]
MPLKRSMGEGQPLNIGLLSSANESGGVFQGFAWPIYITPSGNNYKAVNSKISINVIWYDKFKPSQKAIIFDFITSLSSSPSQTKPSIAKWWMTTEKYYYLSCLKKHSSLSLNLW